MQWYKKRSMNTQLRVRKSDGLNERARCNYKRIGLPAGFTFGGWPSACRCSTRACRRFRLASSKRLVSSSCGAVGREGRRGGEEGHIYRTWSARLLAAKIPHTR